MKRFGIAGLVAVAMVGFAVWWFSPTQVLKRRTESLLETLTLDAASGVPVRQMGAYSLNSILASEVALENPVLKEAQGTFERSDLESAFSWLCNQAKQTRFTSESYRSVKIDGKKARVELVLEALVELPNYRPVDGTYEAALEWEKTDDGWRLNRADWHEAGK